jgi:8-oxo-dGTP diphosphatase
MTAMLQPSHAGGVVYETSAGAPKYLVVGPSSGAGEWVLPKGHIEPGEDHTQAALREVAEETGNICAVLDLAHCIQINVKGEIQIIKFYLMKKLAEALKQSHEKRAMQWLPLKQAIDALTHEESRAAMQAADGRLRALHVLGLPEND